MKKNFPDSHIIDFIRKKNNILVFVIIFLLAFFFRFYNIPYRYGFDFDPTRDALIALYGSKNFVFPQIGPPSGIGPFNFGPWYYYQLILFSIIFPVPYSPWILIGITSLLFVVIMYKIGEILGGKKLGIILFLIAALSPAETGHTQALSNPSLIPLYSVLTFWIFLLLLNRKVSFLLSFFFGFILGIGINIHYEMIPMFIFPILLFVFSTFERAKRISAFIFGIFMPFIPLIVFNILHNWQTLNGMYYYLTQGRSYIPYRWLFYIKDFWLSFWSYVFGVPEIVGLILALCSIITIIYMLVKKQLSYSEKLIILGFVFIFFSLRYLLALREYYYLIFVHPILITILGIVLLKLFKNKYLKYFTIFIFVFIIISMIKMDKVRIATREDFVLFKSEASRLIEMYPYKKFAIYACSTEHEKGRVQGIVYFLAKENKLDENGYKIAFEYKNCNILDNNIKNVSMRNILDVSRLNEEALKKSNMVLISPRTIFNSLGLWEKI